MELTPEIQERLDKLNRLEERNRIAVRKTIAKKLEQGCKQYLFTISEEASNRFIEMREKEGLSLNAMFEKLIVDAIQPQSVIKTVEALQEPAEPQQIEPIIPIFEAREPQKKPRQPRQAPLPRAEMTLETVPAEVRALWLTPQEITAIPESTDRRIALRNIIISLQEIGYIKSKIISILNELNYVSSAGRPITEANYQGIYRSK